MAAFVCTYSLFKIAAYTIQSNITFHFQVYLLDNVSDFDYDLASANCSNGTMGKDDKSARTASTPVILFTRRRLSLRKLRMEAARSGKTSIESYASTRSQRYNS